MILLILGTLIFGAGIIIFTFIEQDYEVLPIILLVAGIVMVILGITDLERKTVKEKLLKDKKIEWKVSNDGQPYLILKDSSLVETWKHLE